jgi:hypothetical protein
MIRTTEEASNTKRGDFNEATSMLPVLANQRTDDSLHSDP